MAMKKQDKRNEDTTQGAAVSQFLVPLKWKWDLLHSDGPISIEESVRDLMDKFDATRRP